MKSKSLKCLLVLAWLAGMAAPGLAAQYTAQEKANLQIVRDFYAANDAAAAKGDMKTAIRGIAEKYIAPNYIQHAFDGKNGREAFIQRAQGASPQDPAPGAASTGTSKRPRLQMEPARLLALMADGDRVIQVTARGARVIWNMFRIENGLLAEHWDAGTGGPVPPGGTPPGGTPPGGAAPPRGAQPPN